MSTKKKPWREEEKQKEHKQAAADFRIWPTRDLVVAFKGRLRTGEPLPPRLPEVLMDRSNANVYPYTKGPDFGNDGLGYGDVVSVTLLQRNGSGGFKCVPHQARRTRSGLTPLKPGP